MRILVFILSLFIFSTLGAQVSNSSSAPGPLDLPAMRKILLEKNTAFRISSNGYEQKKNATLTAKSGTWLPSLTLGVKTPFSSSLLATNRANGTTKTNSIDTNFGVNGSLSLVEKFPWDGQLTLTLDDTWDVLSASNTAKATIALSQPIFKRNENELAKEITMREELSTKRGLLKQARDLQTTFDGIYYDWILANANLKISSNRLEKSISNSFNTARKYQSGLLKEIDLLRISLSEQQNRTAYDNQLRLENKSRNDLLGALSFEFDAPIPLKMLDPITNVLSQGDLTKGRYDLQESLRLTLQRDEGILDKDLAAWTATNDFRKTENNYLLNGNLTASLSRVLDSTINYNLGLSANVSLPILDRGDYLRERSNFMLTLNSIKLGKEEIIRVLTKDFYNRLAEIDYLAIQFQNSLTNNLLSERIYLIDQSRFALGVISSDILLKTEDDYFVQLLGVASQAVAWIKAVSSLENKFFMVRRQ